MDGLPGRDKRIEDTRLVPVILDLVTAQDIHEATAAGTRRQTRRNKIVRLCTQAHAQGGVLSLADVALMLHMSQSSISREILEHERAGGGTVPRRGTVHDMGRSVTHKAIICYKRLVEQKPTSQVAQETFHSPDEVEYSVQCSRRVQLCVSRGQEGSHFRRPKRASYRAAESRSFVGMLISAPPKTRLARRGRWGWPPAATVALTSEPSIERT